MFGNIFSVLFGAFVTYTTMCIKNKRQDRDRVFVQFKESWMQVKQKFDELYEISKFNGYSVIVNNRVKEEIIENLNLMLACYKRLTKKGSYPYDDFCNSLENFRECMNEKNYSALRKSVNKFIPWEIQGFN